MSTISSYTNDNAITVKGLWNERGGPSSIYDSDYTNYGLWSLYNSTSTIKIGSPTLSSLGISNDAVITNVKATSRGAIYRSSSNNSDFTTAERYIDINSNKYGLLSGSDGTINDTTKTCDTGDISVKKSDISNDRLYFMYSTKAEGQVGKYIIVYWVYWEITYEEAGQKYCIKLGNNEIKKIYLGNTEIQTVYKGSM